jgi:hypothetical protein
LGCENEIFIPNPGKTREVARGREFKKCCLGRIYHVINCLFARLVNLLVEAKERNGLNI